MAWKVECEDALHRAGVSLGERILRELQRQAARRMPEPGDLLRATRGPDPHRAMAQLLQHRTATQLIGIQTTGPESRLTIANPGSLRCQPGQPIKRPSPCQILTLGLDHQKDPGHPMGSAQSKTTSCPLTLNAKSTPSSITTITGATGNLIPAKVYHGRGQSNLQQRERIKRDTIKQRRLLHRKAAD